MAREGNPARRWIWPVLLVCVWLVAGGVLGPPIKSPYEQTFVPL